MGEGHSGLGVTADSMMQGGTWQVTAQRAHEVLPSAAWPQQGGAQGRELTRCWQLSRTAPSCPPWWESRLETQRGLGYGRQRTPRVWPGRTTGTAGLQGRGGPGTLPWGLRRWGGGRGLPRAKDKKRPVCGCGCGLLPAASPGSHEPCRVTTQPTLGEELNERPCPCQL